MLGATPSAASRTYSGQRMPTPSSAISTDNRLDGGAGNDRLDGNWGNDRLIGGPGADRLIGGVGSDTLDYGGSDAGVNVSLWTGRGSGGHAQGDTISGFENILGSAHADTLIGNGDDNRLDGGAGNDRLVGDWGNDRLIGGPGNDRLIGGPGIDRLEGGAGNDWLHGGAGSDRLIGAVGNDTLYGGGGEDTLEGGAGDDRLVGGPGADTFVFGARHGDDTVADFTDGVDRLMVSDRFDIDDLLASAVAVSGGVRLDLTDAGGGTILLQGLDPRELDEADFLL